jgi:hypothetical protein
MSPPEHASTPVEKLHGLVIDLFTADEFRRWLGSGPYADIVPELPGESATQTDVVDKGLGALERRGRIDVAFFTRMLSARERRSDAINAVAALWMAQADIGARALSSASGASVPNDVDALKEYRAHFDRAALHDSLRGCGSYKAFAAALDDLIALLNTGTVQGRSVTKRRFDFNDAAWFESLDALFHLLRQLRGRYTELVKLGEINENKCTCQFRANSTFAEIETQKRAIIDQLNILLRDAKISAIRDVVVSSQW